MGMGLSKYFPWKNSRTRTNDVATASADEISKVYNVLLHRDPDHVQSYESESSA